MREQGRVESEAAGFRRQPLLAEADSHHIVPDVAGHGQHLLEVHRAVAGGIVLGEVARPDAEARTALEDVVPIHDAVTHARDRGDHLEGGTWGVESLDRPVHPAALAIDLVEIDLRDAVGEPVGVEGRLAGEGQDLAGVHVEHDGGAGEEFALGILDLRQRPFGGALDVTVQGKVDGRALLGGVAGDELLVVPGGGLGPEFPTAHPLEHGVESLLDARRALLAGVLQFLKVIHRQVRELVHLFRQLIGVLDVAEHMGRQAPVRVGAHDIGLEGDRSVDGELVDEAGDGPLALLRTKRPGGAGEGQVRHQDERQGAALAEVFL